MRILIATVTAGAGHLQAAAALEEAWRAARPADTVERVDVLDFVSKKLAAMARAAKELGKPGAAAVICREIARRWEAAQ